MSEKPLKPLTKTQNKHLELALRDVDLLVPLNSLYTMVRTIMAEAGVDESWSIKEAKIFEKIVVLGIPVCTIDHKKGSMKLVEFTDWMAQKAGEVE